MFATLADLGVRHVVVSPGARNGPLSLAALGESRLAVTIVLDERSAGFAALGAAKSSGDPTAVVATSGSAGTHYYPAVVEARHARVPLLVVTADRPPELQGTGAPQTIDQHELYGTMVKAFFDPGVPDDSAVAVAGDLAAAAFATAADGPAGPVHINVPLREPLLCTAASPPAAAPRSVPAVNTLQPERLGELAAELEGRNVIAVAGGHQRSGFGAAAALLGAATGIPLLADVQCRYPGPATVASGDLLAAAGWLEQTPPDVILRLGPIPTSKPLWQWIERSEISQPWVDDGGLGDPLHSATAVYRADVTATVAALAAGAAHQDSAWIDRWIYADEAAAQAARAALADETFPNEPSIAATVAGAAVEPSIVYAGSSMPIRDLDTFAGTPRGPVRVLANRGANVIDGLLSAAAGAALEGTRVYCLTGDVAALHDVGALEWIGRHQLPVTVVVVNNDGGWIFHFLPQADPHVVPASDFTAVFAAPHGRSLVPIAQALGIEARTIEDREALRSEIAEPGAGPRVLEIHTDPTENVAVHRRIRAAVGAALARR